MSNVTKNYLNSRKCDDVKNTALFGMECLSYYFDNKNRTQGHLIFNGDPEIAKSYKKEFPSFEFCLSWIKNCAYL